MAKRSNPRCPECDNNQTIKRGSRQGKKRYFCKKCNKSFSINHRRKRPVFWIPHIDGIPFRSLGDERDLTGTQVYRIVKKEMNSLPDNTWLTAKYCSRYCGILIVDGKFVKVKGYKKKIPFIYGIDYLSHDILVGILAPSENQETFKKFFRLLKTCKYPLKIVVCDDVISSLEYGLKYHYPKAKIQLCQNHYLENIRQKLKTRTSPDHVSFFDNVKLHVFTEHKDETQLKAVLRHFIVSGAKKNVLRQSIVMDIWNRRKLLFTYKKIPDCPKDTNLIELFNSHLNARLKSTKGFKSFRSAERWLNAYMLRRRTKPFTDCGGKFKKLNGKTSLEMTIKKQTDWPDIIGVKAPKM